MLFTADAHDAIARGEITSTVRLWRRPHAKVGGRYRVGAVEVEVDEIELVPFGSITDDDARASGMADREILRRKAAHAGPIDDETLVHRVVFHVVGSPAGSEATVVDADSIANACARLDRLDLAGPRGPWTARVLALIATHPSVVSTRLAALVDQPRVEFKTDVRKLKALGLTESLEVGYRLTTLGAEVLRSRPDSR